MKVSLKILGQCIAVSIAYGIAHDMLTAHLCSAYFLPPYHPILVETDRPWCLALIWGVVATWWVGAGLGPLVILATTAGPWPKLSANEAWQPLRTLVAIQWLLAMILLLGLYLFTLRITEVDEPTRRLAVVAITHSASYMGSILTAIILFAKLLRMRLRRERTAP